MTRYINTKLDKSKITNLRNKSVNKYNTIIYDKIPLRNDDLFVITQEGDRLDNLAFQFYKDSSLWWYIAKANNLNTMNISAGTSLRIPITLHYAKGG